MLLGKVVGTVVSTHKEEKIENIKLLVVDKIDAATSKPMGNFLVAMDGVGAGSGDYVLLVQGSSARMTEVTTGRPCDATIMGIVDIIEIDGSFIYQKSEDVG